MPPCGRSMLSATPELSSASGSARSEDFDDVNVVGTRHVLDACREHRVARLIYTSSFLALPPAGREAPLAANDYQRTKVARTAARTGRRPSGAVRGDDGAGRGVRAGPG